MTRKCFFFNAQINLEYRYRAIFSILSDTVNKDVQENLSERLAEKKTRFLSEEYGEGLCIGAYFYVDISVYFMYLYHHLL